MRSGCGKWSLVIFGGKRTLTSLFLSAELDDPYILARGTRERP